MDVLLRERRTRADGFVEFSDTEISAAAVDIGSGPDQTLQLIGRNVAPRHATSSSWTAIGFRSSQRPPDSILRSS